MKTFSIASPTRQKSWGLFPVALFCIVGMGTGLYLINSILIVVSGGLNNFYKQPFQFGVIACATIVCGFALIVFDVGRPRRAISVLFGLKRAWISREIVSLLLFLSCVILDHLSGFVHWRFLSIAAALMLLFSQGSIIFQCQGISAWKNPLTIPLFISSGLLSGFGYAVFLNMLFPFFGDGAVFFTGAITIALNLAGVFLFLSNHHDAEIYKASAVLRKPVFVILNIGFALLFPLVLLFLLHLDSAIISSLLARNITLISIAFTTLSGGVILKVSIILVAGYKRTLYFTQVG
jgi:DMSO reductase anchor subunit